MHIRYTISVVLLRISYSRQSQQKTIQTTLHAKANYTKSVGSFQSPFEEARANQWIILVLFRRPEKTNQDRVRTWVLTQHTLVGISIFTYQSLNCQELPIPNFMKVLQNIKPHRSQQKQTQIIYKPLRIRLYQNENSKAKANLHSLHGSQRQRQTYGF